MMGVFSLANAVSAGSKEPPDGMIVAEALLGETRPARLRHAVGFDQQAAGPTQQSNQKQASNPEAEQFGQLQVHLILLVG